MGVGEGGGDEGCQELAYTRTRASSTRTRARGGRGWVRHVLMDCDGRVEGWRV